MNMVSYNIDMDWSSQYKYGPKIKLLQNLTVESMSVL